VVINIFWNRAVSFLWFEVEDQPEEFLNISLQNLDRVYCAKTQDINLKLCDAFWIKIIRHNCIVIQAVVILQVMHNAMQFAVA
jgi:hypothetical protein